MYCMSTWTLEVSFQTLFGEGHDKFMRTWGRVVVVVAPLGSSLFNPFLGCYYPVK